MSMVITLLARYSAVTTFQNKNDITLSAFFSDLASCKLRVKTGNYIDR
jgi:hypothetical protein